MIRSSEDRLSDLPTQLCRDVYQPFAVMLKVRQRKVGAQPVVVLGNAPVSHPVKAADAFQDVEWMLDHRSYV